MAEYLPQFFLAWSILIVAVLSPGPSVALILGVATSRGRLPSLITALGVGCGSATICVATVVGITAILAQVAELMTLVRMVGAAYLFWLAFKAFRNASHRGEITVAPVRYLNAWRTWLAAYLLQVTNPKAIFFWLAIASVGGAGDAPPAIVALFVAGSFVISFVGHGGYALLLSSGPVRRLYGRAHRWIEGALGCFFLFAGYKIATAD
ncbi:MAG: LysE family translocator [Nitratireductor sp.]|nr:LysE family translocator [Nitratireductor sp.]